MHPWVFGIAQAETSGSAQVRAPSTAQVRASGREHVPYQIVSSARHIAVNP